MRIPDPVLGLVVALAIAAFVVAHILAALPGDLDPAAVQKLHERLLTAPARDV